MSDDWKQAAVDSWRSFGGNYTPDADDADEITHTDEPESGGDDFDPMAAYLAGMGVDYDTASDDQIWHAAEQANMWERNAEQVLGVQQADAEAAAENDLNTLISDFITEHDATAEEAGPYIELAANAVADGASIEDAFEQAGRAMHAWQNEVNAAAREEHFAGVAREKGMRAGIGAAFERRRLEQGTPAHRANAPATSRRVRSNGPFGDPGDSTAAISDAVSAFAQRQLEAKAVRDLAIQRVRTPPTS